MVKALFNNKVIAQSNNTIVVDRKHYFPAESVNQEILIPSDYRTQCPWKGEAHYYDIEMEGKKQIRAAFYYPEPSKEAQHVKGRIAFNLGVDVVEDEDSKSGDQEKPWYRI